MKFSTLALTSIAALVSAAPTPPYHYEVSNTDASLNGQAFLKDAQVIVEQGGPFAFTLSPENWALFQNAVEGLHPTANDLYAIECSRAEDAKFEVSVGGKVFQFTGKDISTPDSNNPESCVLSVWHKAVDANYFGEEFIENVLHGELLPGKWLGPGPKPANWRD
ncbi:hypothetical protein CJU89_5241 [Yarrowia sp. B02]|nr:hypothetical protein CJU89_5241 [Yarrowia sp. B02]